MSMSRALRGKWEAAYPWLSAVWVGLGAWFFIPAVGVSAIHAVTAAFSAIAAIIVGFLATVLTLLAALGGGRTWRFLKDAGRIPQLLAYVRWPLDGGFALLVLASCWMSSDPPRAGACVSASCWGWPYWRLLPLASFV